MNSPSKIGRLPRPLQKELNRRLLRGDSSTPILEWLNPLPEVQAILQAGFGGAPINKQNLSDWRATGLAKWETRQEVLTEILDFDGEAGELDTATQGRLAERLATNLAGRYARLLHQWDGEVTDGFNQKLRILRSLTGDISQLRCWDHSAARVRLEQTRLETSQEPDNEALFRKFEEWALNLGVQEFLTAFYESERDRERARRKLLDLPPLPEDAVAATPPASGPRACDPQRGAAPATDNHQPPEPEAQSLGSPSSTPSPVADSAANPLPALANFHSTPPFSVNPCQPPAPANQPLADRQSVSLSSLPENGAAERGGTR